MRAPIIGYALRLITIERDRLAAKRNPTWQTKARIEDLNNAINHLNAPVI